MAFTLPNLPYDAAALEPHIDAQTMQIHHGKHHNAYVTNLNAAVEKHAALANQPLEALIRDIDALPADVRTAIRNNGGGHWNHSFFWEILAPNGGGQPSGALAAAIQAKWGSFDAFQKEFNAAGGSRFGSGWAWLIHDGSGLAITSTPNQDNPLMNVAEKQGQPILGVDVWEHAYYLKYQNRRPDYLAAWWNVVNWAKANEHYAKAGGK